MSFDNVLDEVLQANVKHTIVYQQESRIILVPTLLDGDFVFYVAWIEGNKRELYRFIKNLCNAYRLIYRDYKGIWIKRGSLISGDLYISRRCKK